MSNFICPVCGSSNIQTERRLDGFRYCMECRYSWAIGASQQKQTVFDKITESVETLAEVSVCKLDEGVYYSHMIGSFYSTYAKAFAATIEELKKEYKR